jgi:hypothetical protein
MTPVPASRTGLRHRLHDAVLPVLRRTGITAPLLAALVLAHLAFGLLRLPAGAIVKRARLLDEYAALGPLWHFRLADAETRRVAAWLRDEVRPDEILLYDGSEQGYLQLVAPMLFPALLVRDGADPAPGTTAARRVFDRRPPWIDDRPGRLVLESRRYRLRLGIR